MRGLRTAALLIMAGAMIAAYSLHTPAKVGARPDRTRFDAAVIKNAAQMLDQGRHTFRFDTFGDQDFWGGTLQLHKALEGSQFGGVGPGVSPATALAVGLKVDVDALPPSLIAALKAGQVNLSSPASTLALLKQNAVLGVTGYFKPDG